MPGEPPLPSAERPTAIPAPIELPPLPARDHRITTRARQKRPTHKRRRRKMKTKNGTWTGIDGVYFLSPNCYRVIVTYQRNGEQKKKQATVNGTKQDAVRAQLELKDKLVQSADIRQITGNGDLVKAFGPMWLADEDVIRKRKSTQVAYARNLEIFILPFFGEMVAAEVRKLDVKEWKRWVVDLRQKAKKRTDKPYSGATIRQAWRTMSVFLKYVTTMANLPSLFDKDTRYSVNESVLSPERQKATLSLEELKRFLPYLESEPLQFRLILRLVATTGARIGEITSLHRGDFNLEERVVTLRRSNNSGVVNNTTKEKRIKPLPVDEVCLRDLRLYLQTWKPSPEHGEILFLTSEGGLISSGRFQKRLDRLCKGANVPRMTPHGFRRTVNNVVRQGKGGQVVAMAILGHSTVAMHEHYSTAEMDEKRRALAPITDPSPVCSPVGG